MSLLSDIEECSSLVIPRTRKSSILALVCNQEALWLGPYNLTEPCGGIHAGFQHPMDL